MPGDTAPERPAPGGGTRRAPALRRPARPLTDTVVVLDRFERDDVPDIVASIDDEILRWLPLPDPYGEDDARAYLETPGCANDVGEALNFAIRSTGDAPASERLLGSIGVSPSPLRTGDVQIGYWLAPSARGKGVAQRAIALLARHALGARGVTRVEILSHPANIASRRAAERAGARFEGIRPGGLVPPAPDGSSDAAVYALIPMDLW